MERKSRRRKQGPRLIWILPLLCVVIFLIAIGVKGESAESAGSSENTELEETELENIESENIELENTEPEGTASGEMEPQPEDTKKGLAAEILKEMSLEEKVGQMFIARCPDEQAAEKISQYYVGGYILFASDFENKTKDQAIEEIRLYQETSKIPMFIGVDEEGGAVNRVSKFPAFREEPFPSPQDLFLAGGMEAVKKDTEEKSRLLKELGINVNFAPVCDVSQNPSSFIYKRTFGQDAQATGEYVKTVVETMKKEKMGSVLKHFPGYGDNEDTHTEMVYDNRPYEQFVSSDFLPFQEGIKAGADAVLVSHNIVSAMDSSSPASLSEKVHAVLREDLGFQGVIVTDDLVMDGIRKFTDDKAAAVKAVQAGNDLLCCTDFEVQIPAVTEAVKAGQISLEQIDQSVLRILNMKLSLGIIK